MVEYDYEQINKQELIWEDNNMSRLGMLYALNEEDVKKLRSMPEEERIYVGRNRRSLNRKSAQL